MLTGGVRVSSENLGPKAAEKKMAERVEKKVSRSQEEGAGAERGGGGRGGGRGVKRA